ncbi:hypothetical protein ACP275_08G071000 [Erythranthe tilingii]
MENNNKHTNNKAALANHLQTRHQKNPTAELHKPPVEPKDHHQQQQQPIISKSKNNNPVTIKRQPDNSNLRESSKATKGPAVTFGGSDYGKQLFDDVKKEQAYNRQSTWGTPGGHVGATLRNNNNTYFPTPKDDQSTSSDPLPYSFGQRVVFSNSDLDLDFFDN